MTTSRAVIGAIARYQGGRLISSPVLWLATAGSMALTVYFFEGEPATLDFRSVMIAGGCMPLAATALILGHRDAGRDHTSHVGELADTPATGRDLRVLGMAAAVWGPLLLTIPVLAFGMVLAVSDDPAGSWNLAELLTGPLVVVLGHVLGVALGRWLPNPLVPALALVAAVGLFLMPNLSFGAGVVAGPSPLLPWRDPYTDWVQGEPRLPVVHLVYLVGLIAVTVAIAVRRWRWLAAAVVVLIASGAVLSRLQVSGEDIVASVANWEADQSVVCEVLDEVTYCAIDGYQAWIDDWAVAVGRVNSLVPADLQLAEVRQTTEGAHFDSDPTVAHVGGRWDGAGSGDALSLTEQVLAPELGLPGTYGETAELDRGLPECMAGTVPLFVSGQARGVSLVLLASMSVPEAVDPGLGFGGSAQFGQVEMSAGEADLALRIVDHPEPEVIERLHELWGEMVDPATTSAQLAEWFDQPAPEVLTGSTYDTMTCQCSGDGGFQCTGGSP